MSLTKSSPVCRSAVTAFEAPKGTVVAQPSPHRMALVLVAVVFVLVLLLNTLLTYTGRRLGLIITRVMMKE